MDDANHSDLSVPEYILQPIFAASHSSNLESALEHLIEITKAFDGRSDLASRNILIHLLELCYILSSPSHCHLLLLCLKLLRNLCAGEIRNQNYFIEQNGVGTLSSIISSGLSSYLDNEIIRIGLQVLGNVSLGGEKHQHAIWHQFFPFKFLQIAKAQSQGTCDPLCMVIYTCCDGSHGFNAELHGDQGLAILVAIVRTASTVGFKEDWLKLLLSKVCLEESELSPVFSMLNPVEYDGLIPGAYCFVTEQSFLLNILSEILNERMADITVSGDFAVSILGILRTAVSAFDFSTKVKSGLPTGSANIDVLGYSLTSLRVICASDGLGRSEDGSVDLIDSLVSAGLLDLLICLLRDLEPPAIIRKAMKQGESRGQNSTAKLCPYGGFRRDLVAVIGNCTYRRKPVQDEIREKNAILLLLQQCVTDEDNPFLREWGIWSVRNLLEGNMENQQAVSALELQASVDMPEIAELGLQVKVDPKTHRAKLVNAS